MRTILVLGGGLSGFWVAAGAARELADATLEEPAEVVLVDARSFHSMRVRNYELDLEAAKVPFSDILTPIGVRTIQGRVARIDVPSRRVDVKKRSGVEQMHYDRLVVALGSALVRPPIPGLVEHAFDVDTCEGAERLLKHLQALPSRPPSPGRFQAVVIGAGLTGAEITSELPHRLEELAGGPAEVKVTLMDRNPRIADAMGEAQPVIERAMREMGVELRPGVKVTGVTADGVQLEGEERVPAATVVWCGGFRANALTGQLGVPLDELGRLPVDDCMRVKGLTGVYAAGDAATSRIDGHNASVMSCQQGQPMGCFAGHNVAADLVGKPLLPLRMTNYVTCVDLGPWGAVYTEGRERRLVAQGRRAKRTKMLINHKLIYPPRSRDRAEILRSAGPEVPGSPPLDVPASAVDA
ncbi:MAG TPA: FAD-dependent oxidoreductase [Nevskiaceae bacterium]